MSSTLAASTMADKTLAPTTSGPLERRWKAPGDRVASVTPSDPGLGGEKRLIKTMRYLYCRRSVPRLVVHEKGS